MPNKRWNNMHGPNDKSGGGQSNKAKGKEMKPKASAPKKGWFGKFYVKSDGL